MHRIVLSVFVLLFFTVSLPLELDARHHGKRNTRDGKQCPNSGKKYVNFSDNPDILQKELNLTEQQLEKISKVYRSFVKKILDVEEKLEPKKIQLKKLFIEDAVNITSVRQIMKEMAELKVEINMLRIMRHLEIEKVLDTKQKRKFRVKIMRMRQKKCRGCKGCF